MSRKRSIAVSAAFVMLVAALAATSAQLEQRADVAPSQVQAPIFEVDPLWPKPLPNHWVLGWTVGVTVDPEDHIWIVHQATKLEAPELWGAAKESGCCFAAPPVLEFDQAGNLLSHWGGPGAGYNWMDNPHGVFADAKGNIWMGGNGQGDSQILKFTQSGKFLLQIGRPNMSKGSNDLENVNKGTKVWVDDAANEAYVSDGYSNRRLVVFDATTGKYKRHWGAYGNKPDDTNLGNLNPDEPPVKQFRLPVHCVAVSNDGLVYVCDRKNNRLQVFRKDGTFVAEQFWAKRTLGDGAVGDVAFSRDPQQKYLYVSDPSNQKIYIVDRVTLQTLTSIGDGGRQPGQFYSVHSIFTDSTGNLYTAETRRGQRLQKFVYKGLGPVTKADQGVVWPSSSRQ